jgi:hypothetical protein
MAEKFARPAMDSKEHRVPGRDFFLNSIMASQGLIIPRWGVVMEPAVAGIGLIYKHGERKSVGIDSR